MPDNVPAPLLPKSSSAAQGSAVLRVRSDVRVPLLHSCRQGYAGRRRRLKPSTSICSSASPLPLRPLRVRTGLSISICLLAPSAVHFACLHLRPTPHGCTRNMSIYTLTRTHRSTQPTKHPRTHARTVARTHAHPKGARAAEDGPAHHRPDRKLPRAHPTDRLMVRGVWIGSLQVCLRVSQPPQGTPCSGMHEERAL